MFDNVQPVLHAKVPIIRSKHRQSKIEIDISFHNSLVNRNRNQIKILQNVFFFEAIENTRLLKRYTEIDDRVIELGYMVKHFAKV